MGLTEQQCERLLELERAGKSRPRFIVRIYGRYSQLRREREHKEIGYER